MAGQPVEKAFFDINDIWPEKSWEITENGIYYQASYIRMLAYFVEQAPPPDDEPVQGSDVLNAQRVIAGTGSIEAGQDLNVQLRISTDVDDIRGLTIVDEIPQGFVIQSATVNFADGIDYSPGNIGDIYEGSYPVKWRFATPTTLDGNPVPAETEIVIDYVLTASEQTGTYVFNNLSVFGFTDLDDDSKLDATENTPFTYDIGTPSVTVTEPDNHAPVLDTIGNQSAQVGQPIQIPIQASDEDENALTYSASGIP